MQQKPIPTKPGDVLILRTKVSFTIYAVGSVTLDGQDDFHRDNKIHHVRSHSAAVMTAKALLTPTGRMYLLDIDTDEWSEIDPVT